MLKALISFYEKDIKKKRRKIEFFFFILKKRIIFIKYLKKIILEKKIKNRYIEIERCKNIFFQVL